MSNKLPGTVLADLLRTPRFEVLPTDTIAASVRSHLPRDVTVTVTASPTKGLEPTLAIACDLARDGYDVVPHLAARMVSGRAELEQIATRLLDAGVHKVFVPAGDASTPVGDFTSALQLLMVLTELGQPFKEVDITGYPESHPTIDDDVTIQSMWDKREHATHIISNMTFDAEQVGRWLERLRRRGVQLPVHIGVPGPVERTKLLAMAGRIGVGESMRFLSKQRKVFARIAAPGFSSDRFVQRIAALAGTPALGIAGLHVFTFNQVEVCGRWRTRMLAEARPS